MEFPKFARCKVCGGCDGYFYNPSGEYVFYCLAHKQKRTVSDDLAGKNR